MTYNDAVKFKLLQTPFTKNNMFFIWMVVPLNSQDLNRYVIDYFNSDNILSDEDAKTYSSDNSYSVWSFVRKPFRSNL
jgi:hypothetical protein